MMSSFGILFILVGGLAMLGVVLASQASERTLAGRVELARGGPAQKAEAADPEARPSALERGLAAVQSMFMFRMRRQWGVATRPLFLLVVGFGAAIIVWVLLSFATHAASYVALLSAIAAFFLVPRLIIMREQRRADRLFSELLPDGIDMVVRIVRAGMPVGAAVRAVGQEGNPPLSTTFSQVADQASIGVPFDEALSRIAAAIGNVDFRFFAVAVALQQMTGGNLAATLETLSTIIRRRRAVLLKAHAASAEVRMSATVLGAIPIVVMGALLLVAPGYLQPLFSDWRGNVILGIAAFLLVSAIITMRTMIRNALAT
ncbi:MAG TPA: type II secretion system F family protein [Stellaceae bacterium]|nr:type II secretion system F family protein [Stellaceae bacterium]